MSAFAKLSPQHQLAVSHYRANGRVQHAAWTAAGFSAHSAKSTGARFFNDPRIVAAIAELDGKVLGKLKADGDEVLARIAGIMRGNMADFVSVNDKGGASLDLAKVTREQWANVQQIKIGKDGEVTLKLYDARAAAVDLGKHLGLFKPTSILDPIDETESETTPERQEARLLLLALQLIQGGKNGAQTSAPTKH